MRSLRALVAGSLLVVLPASATQSINQVKGFNANNVYQVNDYDSINAFNGNLTISIPVGNSYPIAEGAAFGLMLHSNSNVWEAETYLGADCTSDPGTVALAHRRANAGMGWILTLGRIFAPGHPTNPSGWTYESPDGAEHTFPDSVPSPAPSTWTSYSEDETYLRMTEYRDSEVKTIEFPDGTKHYFQPSAEDPALWNLQKVTRPSEVGMATERELYHVEYTSSTWTITDTINDRQFVLTFGRVGDFIEPPGQPIGYDGNLDHRMIKTVKFPDGALYTFDYDHAGVGRQLDMNTINKACRDSVANVWLLSDLQRPDGSRFSFTYYHSPGGLGPAGLPQTMTLPTGGVVEWQYAHYEKPNYSADGAYNQYSWGVKTRYQHPRGGTSTESWTYDTISDDDGIDGNGDQPNLTPVYQRTVMTDPIGKVTQSYFDLAWDSTSYSRGHHYGRPYTSFFPASAGSPLWLSQKILSKDLPTASVPNPPLTLRQTIYVQYEEKYPNSQPAIGGRVKAQRVVQNDDPIGNEGRYSDTEFDSWDGLGHYRGSTTDGNALGDVERKTWTNFSRTNAPAKVTTELTIPEADPWITGLHTYVETTETGGMTGTTSSRTDVCMDPNTGFVTGKRVGRNGQVSHDLYSFYSYDSNGNLTSEKSFGGDKEAYSTSDPCTPAIGQAYYQLNHTYDSGVRRQTTYSGVSFKSSDLDIIATTGLPEISRDAAGVETRYGYDNMGRLSSVRPTGAAWTQYTYTNATATMPASVTAAQWKEDTSAISGNELTIAKYYFDGFGRLIQQSKRMPDGWSTVWTEYDVLGRKTRESIPQYADTGNYAVFPVNAKVTTWVYDALGRTRFVTTPDQKTTTLDYIGSREVRRTSKVATTPTNESDVTVVEETDALGRLIKVTESPGAAPQVTNYDYDHAGRLRSVRLDNSSAVVRSFDYDAAGLLMSETHPESGQTDYAYDASGHVWTRTRATDVLKYSYDHAERLTEVLANDVDFKKFVFDRPNSADDKSLGKLDYALRFNRHAALPGGVQQVRETYKYTGPGGAISEKTTAAGDQTFTDRYHYDELAAVKTIDYPTCTGCIGLNAPPRSITANRSDGIVTGVDHYAKDIKYYANGMLRQIRHLNDDGQNGPLYEQLIAADTMARPAEIKVSNYCSDLLVGEPAPSQQTITGGDDYTISIAAPAGAVSVQWYEKTAAGDVILSGATGWSLTRTADVTRRFFARVKNDTCYADSAVATVNVAASCANPATTIVVPDAPIANVTTTASVSPTDGATYAWTIEGNGEIVSGASTPNLTFKPSCGGTMKLKVVVTTNCGPKNGETALLEVKTSTATVSGDVTVANRSTAATVNLALTGFGPWTVTWSDGLEQTVLASTASTGFTTRNILLPVGTDTDTFSVTSVIDGANCAGHAEGLAKVTISAAACAVPDSDFSTNLTSILHSSETDVITAPSNPLGPTYTYVWSINNGAKFAETLVNKFHFQVGCSGVATITLTVTENTCGLTSTTTKTISILPAKASLIASPPKVYVPGETPVALSFEAEGMGMSVLWSDGGRQISIERLVPPRTLTRSVQPATTTTYSIVNVRDYKGCPGTTLGSSVEVKVCDAPSVQVQAPAIVNAGESVSASVPFGFGTTYSWQITGGTLTGGATTSSVTFTPSSACTGSVTLQVSATTICGVTRQNEIVIPVAPSTASATGTATISQGSSTEIRATLTGIGPWTVRWSDQDVAEQVTSSPQKRSVSPSGTRTYTIVSAKDSRDCNAMISGEAEVTVIPPAPTVVNAKFIAPQSVLVTWSYAGEADTFVVKRNGIDIVTLTSSTARSYSDASVAMQQAYVYRVVASKNDKASEPSLPDLATTIAFEDDPLLPEHGIREQHIQQLRTAVNAVRVAAGLGPQTFTDASLLHAEVKAQHFNELRTALDPARVALGLSSLDSDRWPLQPVSYEMWLTDVKTLRGGVQ